MTTSLIIQAYRCAIDAEFKIYLIMQYQDERFNRPALDQYRMQRLYKLQRKIENFSAEIKRRLQA